MNEIRCKTCAHWDQTVGRYGYCRKAGIENGEMKDPESIAWVDVPVESQLPDVLHLQTRDDFGCVQWDRRDASPS